MKKKGQDRDAGSMENAPSAHRGAGAGGRGLWIAALVLLTIGLALCGELLRLHIEATSDAAYHSYCAVDDTVSCDTVARSAYAVFWGVPLAVWGAFGYVLMSLIAVFGMKGRTRAMAALFTGLAVFSLAVSVVLAGISHFVIHAWCLVCIGTYGVNLALLVISFLLMRQGGMRAGFQSLRVTVTQNPRRSLVSGGLTGAVALGLILVYPPPPPPPSLLPPLQDPSPKADASTEKTTGTEAVAPAAASEEDAIPPLKPGIKVETGVTEDGLPWIGAANPVVTITEFFDYECSHCRQALHGLHRLLEANPDRLRLVLRHFPLNSDCNRFISRPIYPYSCVNAKMANCAREQERFFEAHEYLFENSFEEIESATLVSALGLNAKKFNACMKRDNAALNADIEAGIALDLHGTPVFVVDGNVHLQYLPRYLSTVLRPPAATP
ncbi:MAG: thioredoxin domain-containing protein [Deltaproteobacteria bacterium]|nr:thioredoxin domain-containing protein [Deltaproteobacteria bacterium]